MTKLANHLGYFISLINHVENNVQANLHNIFQIQVEISDIDDP